MARTRIPVDVRYVESPETGILAVLPSDSDIDRELGSARLSLTKAQKALDAADPEDPDKPALQESVAALTLRLRDIEATRETINEASRHGLVRYRKFIVLKPTYGQVLAAEAQARHIDPDGEVTYRRETITESLLPDCIEGLSVPDIDELEYGFANYLRAVILRVMSPGEDNLQYFILSASRILEGHPVPPDRVFFEVQAALQWRATGELPERSIYELDSDLAQSILQIKQELVLAKLWG